MTYEEAYVVCEWEKPLVIDVVSTRIIEAQNLTGNDGIEYTCSSQGYFFVLWFYDNFEKEYKKHYGLP